MGAPAETPDLLTRAEVARIFRIQVATLDGWARDGRIRAVRLPTGHRRFRREDVEELIQRGLGTAS